MSSKDIESLDCELAVYRKGFLSVHIDLARGYLTWRESNSWINNFTRSLHPEQIERIRDQLYSSGLLLQMPEDADAPLTTGRLLTVDQPQDNTLSSPSAPYEHCAIAWALCLKTPRGYRRGSGSGSLPEGWQDLCAAIESISRMPFTLY